MGSAVPGVDRPRQDRQRQPGSGAGLNTQAGRRTGGLPTRDAALLTKLQGRRRRASALFGRYSNPQGVGVPVPMALPGGLRGTMRRRWKAGGRLRNSTGEYDIL